MSGWITLLLYTILYIFVSALLMTFLHLASLVIFASLKTEMVLVSSILVTRSFTESKFNNFEFLKFKVKPLILQTVFPLFVLYA